MKFDIVIIVILSGDFDLAGGAQFHTKILAKERAVQRGIISLSFLTK